MATENHLVGFQASCRSSAVGVEARRRGDGFGRESKLILFISDVVPSATLVISMGYRMNMQRSVPVVLRGIFKIILYAPVWIVGRFQQVTSPFPGPTLSPSGL